MKTLKPAMYRNIASILSSDNSKFKSAQSRLVALTIVEEDDEVMMVTANGIVTKIKANSISQQGRPATGVRAQNLVDNDSVVSVEKIVNPEKGHEGDNLDDSPTETESVEQGKIDLNITAEADNSADE